MCLSSTFPFGCWMVCWLAYITFSNSFLSNSFGYLQNMLLLAYLFLIHHTILFSFTFCVSPLLFPWKISFVFHDCIFSSGCLFSTFRSFSLPLPTFSLVLSLVLLGWVLNISTEISPYIFSYFIFLFACCIQIYKVYWKGYCLMWIKLDFIQCKRKWNLFLKIIPFVLRRCAIDIDYTKILS